ncbi:hypothetical protein [uncultured Clostridium sp.]|uniref:hypothetical protein n=1 Tax=uncultured Clostridium sp. TaxID=59620 RepID=UPI002607DD2A|nr:hypothetical protein [uncultured Clostridium sp.]
MAEVVREAIVDGIKVTVRGELSDYARDLYHERLAMILLDKLGREGCYKLLELLKPNEDKTT